MNTIKFCIVIFSMPLFLTSCKSDKKSNKENPKQTEEAKIPQAINLEKGLTYSLSLESTDKLATSGGTFAEDKKGNVQGAFSLNGKNEYVLIKDRPELNPEEEITISIWYKPVSFKGIGNNAIINKGFEVHEPPFYQYHLGITGNEFDNEDKGIFTFTLTLDDVGVNLKTPTNIWKPNNWYHIVATYNGKEVALHINGEYVVGKKYDNGFIYSYGKDLCIGKFSNINKYTPGTFDNLRIYNRALSPDEIDVLYKL